MIQFEVDGRDNFSNGSMSCDFCCSERATAVPGEVNKWRLSYAPWFAGMKMARFIPPATFAFVKLTPNPPAPFPSVLPPVNTDYQFQIAAGTAYNGTVATNASSPQSTPLTFAADPVNPPTNGIVAMNSNGTFIYNPTPGFTGVDTFAFTTSDNVNPPLTNLVIMGVDTVIADHFTGSLPAGVINLPSPETGIQVYETNIPPSEGLLFVDPTKVVTRGFHLEFPLNCSPENIIGQIYRMTVAVQAMECDGTIYRHISTYDVQITKCGQSY